VAGDALIWPRDYRGRLAAVVLHFGDPRRTAQVVEQLRRGAAPETVRVLDNAAPQPFPDPWVRLPENLYWGGALAWTVARLRDEGYSHVWFLNDDVTFLTPTPVPTAWMRLGEIQALVGRVAVYSPAWTAHPYHPQMVVRLGGNFRCVRFCDGAALLVHLGYVVESQVAWEDNPAGYGVDVVLSGKASCLGWKVVVDDRLLARHLFHASARKDPGFLHWAAQLEAAYLTRHLGPDFRQVIQRWASEEENDLWISDPRGRFRK